MQIQTNVPIETCDGCVSGSIPATYVEYGVLPEGTRTALPADFQGCLGYGPDDQSVRIVPYSGEFDVCNENQAPFFLTAKTIPIGRLSGIEHAQIHGHTAP